MKNFRDHLSKIVHRYGYIDYIQFLQENTYNQKDFDNKLLIIKNCINPESIIQVCTITEYDYVLLLFKLDNCKYFILILSDDQKKLCGHHFVNQFLSNSESYYRYSAHIYFDSCTSLQNVINNKKKK